MLLRHSANYVLARGLPGLLNFVALYIYTRLLRPDDYGRYALVLAGISMAGVMVFQWQRLVLARWLAMRKEDSQQFLGEMLWIFLFLATVSGVLGSLLGIFWPDPLWQRLLFLAVILFVVHGWVELNLTLAASQLAPGNYGRILGAKALLSLLVGGALAWFEMGAYAPILGLLFACILAVPLSGIGAWREIKPLKPKHIELKEQLRYGLPLIISFALGWIIASSDRLFIGGMINAKAVGQYAVGYDLAQFSLGLLLGIIQVAAYPLVVTALESQGVIAAKAQIRRNGELIVGVALASAAGLAVLAPEVASVVVGDEFRLATESLLPWIVIGAAAGGIKAFYYDLAFHLGRSSRGLVVCSSVTAATNIILNLLLIPPFGILGAAYATLLSFFLGLILSARLGRRVFSMPNSLSIWLRSGSVALVVAASASVGRLWGRNLGGLIAALVLGVATGFIAAYLINLAGMRHEMRSILGRLGSFRR